MNEPKREPFFGQNAKPWIIQFAFVIFCIIVVVPWIGGYMDEYAKPWFNAGFDAICSTTGWCTPEAADRLNVQSHRQAPS